MRDDGYSHRRTFYFEIFEPGAVLFARSFGFPDDDTDGDGVMLLDIAETFVTGALMSTLAVGIRWTHGTGGGAGGSCYLSRLKISEN